MGNLCAHRSPSGWRLAPTGRNSLCRAGAESRGHPRSEATHHPDVAVSCRYVNRQVSFIRRRDGPIDGRHSRRCPQDLGGSVEIDQQQLSAIRRHKSSVARKPPQAHQQPGIFHDDLCVRLSGERHYSNAIPDAICLARDDVGKGVAVRQEAESTGQRIVRSGNSIASEMG